MIIPFFVNLNKKMGRNLKTYWRNLTKIFLKIVTENVMLRIYSLPLPFINYTTQVSDMAQGPLV